MSGSSASANPSTTKATTADDTTRTPSTAQEGQNKKAPLLEEDDEFEDFPVDDWPDSETTANEAKAGPDGSSHLWEESWDDDDTNDDFAVMLKEELKKMDKGGK